MSSHYQRETGYITSPFWCDRNQFCSENTQPSAFLKDWASRHSINTFPKQSTVALKLKHSFSASSWWIRVLQELSLQPENPKRNPFLPCFFSRKHNAVWEGKSAFFGSPLPSCSFPCHFPSTKTHSLPTHCRMNLHRGQTISRLNAWKRDFCGSHEDLIGETGIKEEQLQGDDPTSEFLLLFLHSWLKWKPVYYFLKGFIQQQCCEVWGRGGGIGMFYSFYISFVCMFSCSCVVSNSCFIRVPFFFFMQLEKWHDAFTGSPAEALKFWKVSHINICSVIIVNKNYAPLPIPKWKIPCQPKRFRVGPNDGGVPS